MTRLYLFLSSLSPGVLVAGIRSAKDNLILGIGVVLLATILAVVGLVVVRSRANLNAVDLKLTVIKDETYQVPTYLVTFVLPFLFIDIGDPWTLGGYLAFSSIVFVMLMRSNISMANPILLFLGYRLFDAQDNRGHEFTVISKSAPSIIGNSTLHKLSGNFYIQYPRKQGSDES